jgi:molecular chaperone GrpE
MAENLDINAENAENMADQELEINLNNDDNAAGTLGLEDSLDNSEESQNTELAELKDKFVRKVAEFENYKRRTAGEMLELRQTAGKEVILNILEVLDDYDRAEKQITTGTDIEAMREGVVLIFNKLRKTLEQNGLKVMDAQGTEFDVELHEALTEIPAPSPDMEGKVVDVIQKGYYMRDKLIRFAKVVVGK